MNQRQITQPQPSQPAVKGVLQRACACGQHTSDGGECEECKRKRMGTLQRAAIAPAPDIAPPIVHDVLRSPGQPLNAETRAYMEPRFGHDFSGARARGGAASAPTEELHISSADDPLESEADQIAHQVIGPPDAQRSQQAFSHAPFDLSQVRIHTDAPAATSAQAVSALAYTVGSHIVFGAGQYAPQTSAGKRLLAHELTHVGQQNNGLYRCPDPATEQQFDQRASAIRNLDAYKGLPRRARQLANQIMTIARRRDNCLYYLDKLELLFATADQAATSTASEFRQIVRDAADQEQSRMATAEGQRLSGVEEALSGEAGRQWTERRGQDNKIFRVDNSDPNNIVVRARVRLQRRGQGTEQDVGDIRSLEDAIEKAGSTSGYTLNLEFVTTNGPDVFTVGVDMSQWTTSGNWVGRARSLAHELHHLLRLDDRYNYIEAHAGNPKMKMATRLHWFRVQMDRADDPLRGESLMGSGKRMLDDDVCRVAGLDLATCMATRQARRAEINGVRGRAFGKVFGVFETLAGIRPASPHDQPGMPSQNDMRLRQAQSTAAQVFGRQVPLADLLDQVRSIRNFLTPSTAIEVAPATDSACQSASAYTSTNPPQIRLCPPFLTEPPEQQRRQMIRQAARLTGVQNDTPCAAADCNTACGDPDSADTWAQFIECAQ
jgi:hypothetical protein